MDEFSDTPASSLSFEEFVALDENAFGECDPPIVKASQKSPKRKRKAVEEPEELYIPETQQLPNGPELEAQIASVLYEIDTADPENREGQKFSG